MNKTKFFKILSVFLCLILLIQVSVYAVDIESLIDSYINAKDDTEKQKILDDLDAKIEKDDNRTEYQNALKDRENEINDWLGLYRRRNI